MRRSPSHATGDSTVTVLIAFDAAERRHSVAAGGAWHGLAMSLEKDLEPLHTQEAPIPPVKARLTRIGGRCTVDGSPLLFDPYEPNRHRCALCGAVYERKEDYEWWAMGANLWTVERAVHASALALLGSGVRSAGIARSILERFADQYLKWPNKDNVLGPSRPFFSTYLESIWLLNVCHSVALLERLAAESGSDVQRQIRSLGGVVRDRIIEPSLTLIESFNEGLSNRQVWNEVAILSSLLILGRRDAFESRIVWPGGVLRFLSEALDDDGVWYEGENYHQFAHRGLWYAVQLMDAQGVPIPSGLRDRYRKGFLAPFRGLLPDDTFPSRMDSRYKVSIHQWRIAEWCELGLTECYSRELSAIRTRLYADGAGCGATGRSESTADAERDMPAGRLGRADCSWRALLAAADAVDVVDAAPLKSVLIQRQGLAVIRRDSGNVYVALEGEGGHGSGGHGHPDALALTLQVGKKHYLDDPGTGSYVEQKLHWYRSTLAHHAPLIDRRSQRLVSTGDSHGKVLLDAFEDRGAAGWISRSCWLSQSIWVRRSVMVCDGYLIDLLEWRAESDADADAGSDAEASDKPGNGGPGAGGVHELTLPICAGAEFWHDAESVVFARSEAQRTTGSLEDGFGFVSKVEVCAAAGTLNGYVLPVEASEAQRDALSAWFILPDSCELVRARVPAPPGRPGTIPRHWLRMPVAQGSSGRLVSCIAWSDDNERRVLEVATAESPGSGSITGEREALCAVTTADGLTAVHSYTEGHWHIDLRAGSATSSMDFETGNARLQSAGASRGSESPGGHASREVIDLVNGPFECHLGEAAYRRTEQSWEEAGRPSALVRLSVASDKLVLELTASGPVVVPLAGAVNHLDNELADTNATGVQFYIGEAGGLPWQLAWLVVPSDPPRTSNLAGNVALAAVNGASHLSNADADADAGADASRIAEWTLRMEVPLSEVLAFAPTGVVALDVVVNERPSDPERERRRGQLVLSAAVGHSVSSSGGAGFAYLRGDRQPSNDALSFRLAALPVK